MKYKIYDKINKEYLDKTKYCINQDGYIMTTNGDVFMNQEDFEVQEIILKNKESVIDCNKTYEGWEIIKFIKEGILNQGAIIYDIQDERKYEILKDGIVNSRFDITRCNGVKNIYAYDLINYKFKIEKILE